MGMPFEIEYIIKSPKEAFHQAASIYKRSKEQTILLETFIGQSYYPITKEFKKNTLLVDIGSNIGDTPIYFAQFDNVEKVLAYEKDYEVYETGKAYIASSPYYGKIITRGECTRETLGVLIENIKTPIAIKCDIEGGEIELFKNLKLSKHVYAVIMELHDTTEKMVSYFKKQGFKEHCYSKHEGIKYRDISIYLFTRR